MVGDIARADAAPWPTAGLDRSAPQWEPAPILRLLGAPGPAPSASGVVADADLHIKRFRGGEVGEEHSSAALRATSPSLADTPRQSTTLAHGGLPDDHLILTIAIRR